MDLSTIEFNGNQKAEAAGRDALGGVRKLVLAYPAFFVAMACLFYDNHHYWQTAEHIPLLVPLSWAIVIASIGLLLYGTYQIAAALDWEGFLSIAVLAAMFVPYVNLIVTILLFVRGLSLVKRANFRFTLFGAPKKRSAPATAVAGAQA